MITGIRRFDVKFDSFLQCIRYVINFLGEPINMHRSNCEGKKPRRVLPILTNVLMVVWCVQDMKIVFSYFGWT